MKYVNGKFVHVPGEEYYFSENLRMLRFLQVPHLTQEKLAKKLGVSQQTYAKYELGRTMSPAWFVLNAANYFKVPVEQMLGEQLNKKGLKKKE